MLSSICSASRENGALRVDIRFLLTYQNKILQPSIFLNYTCIATLLYVFNVVCAARLAICRIALVS